MNSQAAAAEIAKGLTAAQRDIVLTQDVRVGGMNPPRRYLDLCDRGLADCTIHGDNDGERWSFRLTPPRPRRPHLSGEQQVIITIDVHDCPKCGSDNLKTWDSHRCQAWFVICCDCQHEDGRERTEREAISTWNRNALLTPENSNVE